MMLLSKEKPMRAKQVVSFALICMALCWMTAGKAQAPGQKAPARLYNTAKQKLVEGKQIVGATVFSPDPNIYCAIDIRVGRENRGADNLLAFHEFLLGGVVKPRRGLLSWRLRLSSRHPAQGHTNQSE